MKQRLIEKLHRYLALNSPDVLVALQEESGVTSYLEEKVSGIVPMLKALEEKGLPGYIIEERCMDSLTADLRPSRYLYLRSLLEEEFEGDFLQMREAGILTLEITGMIRACAQVFETLDFNEANKESRELYYAITGTVHAYLGDRKEGQDGL
ncbi:DUF1896 family protein [Galbibacter sp. EGI 63066]|uniref:DUF1896 family protein n=1 Tax=Galbibacter sp. EGI 63066 TaxID=2993559 RepID=UPI00224889B0|nr:DUF1896 family protein [Galbibacter sp. EGI 63066]MCX2680984.1 DUF1896 family protein [Galbibacter sp. EGI 63066]